MTNLQLGLERLLGELLLIEVDRELHVVAVDRRNPPNLTNDPARVVDLVGDGAPLAVEFVLHAQFDAELSDTFVLEVALALVPILGLGGDGPHVADDMAGERRVGIHASRLLEDLDTGEVLDAFLDRDGRAFVDVLGNRHRQERAVHLTVESRLHLLDRHIDPTRQAPEDLGSVVTVANHLPVDRDGEHPIVVGQDPAFGVEDAATLGQQRDVTQLGGVDLGLQRLLLDGLQEPQPCADEPEEQCGHEREHAESGGSLVSSHETTTESWTSTST